ncbi:MAG: molybdenum cofactor guanylyltransferase [Mariniphaga sp.]
MAEPKITGIVLAGGKSSRMGSDKSKMILNSKTLIEYSIEALKPLCETIVISSNNNIYDYTGCEAWPDDLPDGSPMIGIYSCLKRSQTEYNIFLSCDIPLISTSLLEYLLSNSSDFNITVPIHGNNLIEPLCGIYKKSCINVLKGFIDQGNYRLNECIRSSTHQLVKIDPATDFPENLFTNINTQEDFRKLLIY